MKASQVIMVFSAAGTWFVAAMAIWGEWIRSYFFRPNLRVERIGLSSQIVRQNNGMDARYYHVRVSNVRPRRFPAAREVQLLITLVEKPDANGDPYVEFGETLPLWWVRQEILPLFRTVGPDADASLLFVRQDGTLQFTPIVSPNHFPCAQIAPVDYWVTLQAKSIEIDSLPLRLKIRWDGVWDAGEKEIQRHLSVSDDPRRPI